MKDSSYLEILLKEQLCFWLSGPAGEKLGSCHCQVKSEKKKKTEKYS